MSWQEPKTDWTADDYFNAQDWERITHNIEYVKDLVATLFEKIVIEEMQEKNYASMIYAREVNGIEKNLQAVNWKNYFDVDSTMVTWQTNRATPTYKDFNRWENNLLVLKTKMDSMIDALDYCDDDVYCVENGSEIGGLI